MSVAVTIVIDHQGALAAGAVGIRKDVFDHRTVGVEEVVEQEVRALGEEPAALEQRRDLALVALDEPMIGIFLVARPAVFHAVFFCESLDLAVAEHGQPGQRRHHDRDAKIFIALAELIDGGAFIGIGHEVDVALHDVGIELERVLDDGAILGVVLVPHHDHEGRVVDAMHAEGADEVALHEPECFSEEQGAGHFGGDSVDHLAPELVRHGAVEIGLRHAVFRTRWNGAAGAGARKPQAMKMPLGEGHGRVKANDRKQARDVQDGLNHLFADGSVQVVELRGVVPGKAGAVVAVIDVAGFAAGFIATAKDHGGIGLVVIVILDLEFNAAVVGEIGSFEGVGGIGRIGAGDEPLGVLNDPGRIDAHVVGHHVAGQSDPMVIGAVAQGDVGRFAAEIVGNAIVEERIGRGDGILIAAELLDGAGGAAALPNADEPERIDAVVRDLGEIFVGDLVKAADVAAVFAAQLREPHIGAFGDEDRTGHPRSVGRELFVFVRC